MLSLNARLLDALGQVFGARIARSVPAIANFYSTTALPLTAAVLALTDKQTLYGQVWWSSFWTWIVVSIIGTAITFVITLAIEGCNVRGLVIMFGLIMALLGGYINAGIRATHAYTDAWDQKVIEKATHIEKLLGVWVRYDEIQHPCHYADTDSDEGAISATGCKNVTKDSYCASEDEDGNCDDTDYEWFPWFVYEVSRTAELNVYQNGHVVFSYHCAPPDWQSHLMGNRSWLFPGDNIPRDSVPGVSFCYEVPYEWRRIKDALDQRPPQLLPGVVYHNYLNWVAADPETVFRGSTYLVPEYEALGLMPTVNSITDSQGNPYVMDIYGNTSGTVAYDFEIVQFLGTLDPTPEFQRHMQEQALLWNSVAFTQLNTNLMVNFAYADEVPERSQWTSVTKAHLMDKSVFGRNILPANLSVFNCGVSRDLTQVLWCNMETGLFEGNVELKQDILRLQPFSFTPEAMFGAISGGFMVDASGNPIMQDLDWDDRATALATVDISFNGGIINEAMHGVSTGHPFKQVSMDRYATKQYVIQPDPEQVEAIKSEEFARTLKSILSIWGIIIIGGSYGIKKNER